MILLRTFWPYLIGAGVIAGGLWWGVSSIRASGYREGTAARDAYWKPRFEQAEKDKSAADARAETIDHASKAIRAELEQANAEIVRKIESRAAASGVRMAGVVRELAACSQRQQVSTVAADDGFDARAAALSRRAGEIGEAIAGVGRDCALDAATISDWHAWNRRNAALRQSAIPD